MDTFPLELDGRKAVLAVRSLVPYVGNPSFFAAITGSFCFGDLCARSFVVSLVLLLTDDGRLWMWGDNRRGQLGQGDTQDRATPTVVESLVGKRVVQVALGYLHTIVITGAVCASMPSLCICCFIVTVSCPGGGLLYAFGWNELGQLGLGDTEDRSTPTRVVLLEGKDVVNVGCGWTHSIALLGALCVFFHVLKTL